MFSKAPFQGSVAMLLAGADRAQGLEKSEVAMLDLRFEGIAGDCHGGLTRKSDSRTLKLYRRDIDIKNTRQVSIVSIEDLRDIAEAMALPAIHPEWLGANMLLEGIPDLTLLPPSTRLQFPSGATLTVDLENGPCRQVAEVIAGHHPNAMRGFVTAAQHKRGVTAWVERQGIVRKGDAVTLFLPPQRLYAHA
jgi:hypothetical protein